MKQFKIGKTLVGDDCATFIVAEMSGNHGGKIENALKIIDAAASIGATAVKLQTYTADTITLNCENDDFLISQESPWSAKKTFHHLYEEAYTPWEWHGQLFDRAKELGLEIFSSPFDFSAVDFLEKLDCSAYKIASPEITDIPLLEKVGQTGKPVIFSIGVATKEDIELAIETLRGSGCNDIAIMKCTTAYPAPFEEANLNTIKDIPREFDCIVGLSDHSKGIALPIAATVLGAKIIEKHIKVDSLDNSVDSFFSLNEFEFKLMIDEIHNVEKAMGEINYNISESAKPSVSGRRSLYVSQDVKKGKLWSSNNVKSVRPSFGLHPKYYSQIIGTKIKRDMRKGDRLTMDDLIED